MTLQKKREHLSKKLESTDSVLSKRSKRRRRKGGSWTKGKGINLWGNREDGQRNIARSSTSPISEVLAQVEVLPSGGQLLVAITAHRQLLLLTWGPIGDQSLRDLGHKGGHLKLVRPSLQSSHPPPSHRKQRLVGYPPHLSIVYKQRFSRRS